MAKAGIQKKIKGGDQKVGSDKPLRKGLSEYHRVFRFIGISNPGPDSFNEIEYINHIRSGFSYAIIANLADQMEFSDDDFSSIFHISKRTMSRRKPEDSLNAEQTERAIELARLYVRGEEVFGEMNLFKEWMNRNLRALGNKKPKEFLDTSIGIHFIMDELGRIEHGVFA
jgi:putative toxin-antitoxin system antitoxin component (TIGR02293 family)